MKNRILLFVLACLCMLAGCRKANSQASERGIICTTYPVWLITCDLMQGAKDAPSVELLIPAGTGCPHDFALSTQDLLKVSRLRKPLIIRNGAGMDDRIFEALLQVSPDARDTDASGGLEGTAHEHHDAGGHHREEEHHDGADPHLFAAPGSAAIMVRNITSGLKAYDPSNAEIYAKNASKMLKMLDGISLRCKTLPHAKVLMMHDTFRRLAEESGLEICGIVFDGHFSALSPAELSTLIHTVKTEKPALLLTEPQTPDEVVQLLQKETGIAVLSLDPAASGPENVNPGYLTDKIGENISLLEKALFPGRK